MKSKNLFILLFLLPSLVLYVVFVVYPILDSLWLSLYDWDIIKSDKKFVGFLNYERLLVSDPVFWIAFKNTILWTLLSSTIGPAISLMLALAFNSNLYGKHFFRSIFYMPGILASIAVATMWKWFYDPFFGLLNSVLVSLGFEVIDWLGNESLAIYSSFVASLWQGVGFGMVLFLAGLQSIDKSQIDAAKIDGANRFQIIFKIILPSLKTTTVIVVVLSIIGSFKAFEHIYGLTGGGPSQSTQLLALWSYVKSFQMGLYGEGSAIGVILLLMTLVVVMPYLVFSLRNRDEK